MISVTTKTDRAKFLVERIAANIGGLQERAADRTLAFGFAEIVKATPKKWFGSVRAGWQSESKGVGKRRLWNDRPKTSGGTPIVTLLEHGTANEGQGFIYPKTARALYIPLRRTAVVYRKGLKFGRDYVLAKRVRGIKPRHFVKATRVKIKAAQVRFVRDELRRLIHGN